MPARLTFMKKIAFTLAFTGISLFCLAQQSQFGIFAGGQASAARYSIAGEKQSVKSKYGFQLGAGWKIPFEEHLYFAPAAFYSLKGFEVDLNKPSFPPDANAVHNDIRLHTFELAFLLQYDLSRQPGHLFIKAGPSLDFQLSGTEKFRKANGDVVDRKMRFGFGDYGRYAASMLAQLGYEWPGGFYLFGQYSHGMGSFNNADHGPRIVHRVYGLSVGHYLGKKRKIVIDTRNRQ